jgi:CheY-like chemotaxis protein
LSQLSGKRILVVDDNMINLDIAAETLSACGAEVETATGGGEAIELIGKARYDLILLDLSMPDIDGLAVGRAVRASETNASTAIMLFTASDAGEAKAAVRELNAKGYVSKPVDVDDLSRKVQQHV